MPKNPLRGAMKGRMPSKTTRLHLERLRLYSEQMKCESELDYDVQSQVPEAWDTLEQDVDVEEKKVQITLRLDESVAKFYRAMGQGYQARINRILATFAQMRMGQVRRLHEMMEEEMAEMRERRQDGSAG